jgi:hypothetical protein
MAKQSMMLNFQVVNDFLCAVFTSKISFYVDKHRPCVGPDKLKKLLWAT